MKAPSEYLNQLWVFQFLWALVATLTAGQLGNLAPQACSAALSVLLTGLSWLALLMGGVLSRMAFNNRKAEKEKEDIENKRKAARNKIKKELQGK